MNEILRNIIYAINNVVGNYGWSIVVFTVLIRVVLTPLDYSSRRGMRKMQLVQPQMQALQKKYANDQEKLNRKMQELYKKEHVSPLSSCLPMIISMALLWVMFAAMRYVANENIVQQIFDILQGKEPVMDGWLWVRNIWQPDSPFHSCWPSEQSLRMAMETEVWQKGFAAVTAAGGVLPESLALTAESFTKEALSGTIQNIFAYMQTLPAYVEATARMAGWPELNLWIARVNVMQHYNGFYILPILSAVTQFLMTIVQPQQPAGAENAQAQSTGKFMKWFFPLFSLWICSSYNAIFAIYWVASNIVAAVQNQLINWYLDKKDKDNAGRQDVPPQGNASFRKE